MKIPASWKSVSASHCRETLIAKAVLPQKKNYGLTDDPKPVRYTAFYSITISILLRTFFFIPVVKSKSARSHWIYI